MTYNGTTRRMSRDAAVVRAYQAGQTTAELAEVFDLHENAVKSILRRNGNLRPEPDLPSLRATRQLAPPSLRGAVVCLRVNSENSQTVFAAAADAFDHAQHATTFGCAPQCRRVHMVVWVSDRRYRSRTIEAADTCGCTACRAKAQREADRKERARQRARVNYRKNRDHHREVQKRYVEANAERVREKNRAWHRKNRDHRREYNRKYVEEHRERIRAYQNERNRKRREAAAQSAERAAGSNAVRSSPVGACGSTPEPAQAESGRIFTETATDYEGQQHD